MVFYPFELYPDPSLKDLLLCCVYYRVSGPRDYLMTSLELLHTMLRTSTSFHCIKPFIYLYNKPIHRLFRDALFGPIKLLLYTVNPHIHFLIIKRHKSLNASDLDQWRTVPPYNVLRDLVIRQADRVIVRYTLSHYSNSDIHTSEKETETYLIRTLRRKCRIFKQINSAVRHGNVSSDAEACLK